MNARSSFAALLCCFVVNLSATTFAADAGSINLYVSLTGNDAWSGTISDAKPDKSDGPLATLEHARDRVREMRRNTAGQWPKPVTIALRGGRYELSQPFALAPIDSGSQDNPLTICAVGQEKPILSGGRRLAFTRQDENGRELWVAPLPAGLPGDVVRELWVNGQRRVRARFPAEGYLKVAPSPDLPKDWRTSVNRFHFHEGDLKSWPSAGDAELVVMSHWVESRLPVKRIDEKDRVSFGKQTTNGVEAGDVYFLEGAKDFLTQPGDWCEDRSTKTIRYLPLPGEKLGKTEAIVPALQQVMILRGEPDQGKYVEYVVFRGIGFSHVQWDLPDRDSSGTPGPSGFHQADISVSGAVLADGLRSSLFDHCAIEHAGGYGIELASGCQHDKITHCTIQDLGAGGIKIGETRIRDKKPLQTFAIEISDCRITDGGNFYPSGVGVWFGQTYDNILSHNEIANFYYTGISVGWTWGYGRSLPKNNVIENNDVHHIGVKSITRTVEGKPLMRIDGPILSDMGGIYTLGGEPGTIIRNNRFHDIAGIRYGGWGIYFDEGSTDITAENNLVYRTTHGGLHQHYGKDNIFRNNIIAFAREWQIQRTRAEDHRSFTFEHNIIYFDRGHAVEGDFKSFNVAFNHNDYWAFDKGQMRFAGLDLHLWQERGMDVDSIVADPKFIDPEHDNYSLADDSPALRIGFKPFNLDDVGPRDR